MIIITITIIITFINMIVFMIMLTMMIMIIIMIILTMIIMIIGFMIWTLMMIIFYDTDDDDHPGISRETPHTSRWSSKALKAALPNAVVKAPFMISP